jgi:hypothetical protein
MSIKAIMKRKRSSHRIPLLTIDEKNKLIQRTIVERMNHLIVNQKWTRETISDITNTRIQGADKAFITNFWEKNHWLSFRVQTRNQKELRNTLDEEALAFQESVIRYTQENQIPKKYLYYG